MQEKKFSSSINIWAHSTTRILSGNNPRGNYLVPKVAFLVVYIFKLVKPLNKAYSFGFNFH